MLRFLVLTFSLTAWGYHVTHDPLVALAIVGALMAWCVLDLNRAAGMRGG